jgi:hypothetical protein
LLASSWGLLQVYGIWLTSFANSANHIEVKMKLTPETVEMMVENSFKNFHVKGFDYLCLKRTPAHTRKIYFFDGNVSHLPDVVSPHDHRYDFTTTVLCGHMSNSHYKINNQFGEVFNEFEYRTPLNGGNGFTFKKEVRLRETRRDFYIPGWQYTMRAEEFHTIRMHKEGTIIMLDQYDDVVPIDTPTRTFISNRKAPDLNGLYEKFTPDEVIDRYNKIQHLLEKF